MAKEAEEKFKFIASLRDNTNPSMGSDFDRWIAIRNKYRKELNKEIWIESKSICYTPHDYNTHCINIYGILDSLLLQDVDLNPQECFLLAIAVLLHDVTMHVDILGARERHSQRAAKYIEEEMFNDGVLTDNLDLEESEILKKIVLCHSDIKENGIVKNRVFSNMDINDNPPAHGVHIRVTLLAALLRFGDELDQTSARVTKNLSMFKVAEQKWFSGEKTPSEIDSLKKVMSYDSFTHWRTCLMFLSPKRKQGDNSTIQLQLNCSYFKKYCNSGDSENVLLGVKDTFRKIQESLAEVNKVCFNKLKSGWLFHSVEIYAEDEVAFDIWQKFYAFESNPRGMNSSQLVASSEIENGDESALEPKKNGYLGSQLDLIQIIDADFSEKIKSSVFKNGLYLDGHYTINETTSARDWIDTVKLFSIPLIMSEITDVLTHHLEKDYGVSDKVCIMALDFPSIIPATYIARRTGYSMSYIHRKETGDYHIKPEKDLPLDKSYKIILITDVVVTGRSINLVLEQLRKMDYSCGRVYSIFYRKSLTADKVSGACIENIWCLNDDIPIEICTRNKTTCLFREKCGKKHENEVVQLVRR